MQEISILAQVMSVVCAGVWVVSKINSTTLVLNNTIQNLKETIENLSETLEKLRAAQHNHETRISLLERSSSK